jgi:hypothetical protein
MTVVDVVGGVYTERCAFPYWDEMLGSAGRAAVVLSSRGLQVRLHTLLSTEDRELAEVIFPGRGVEVHPGDRDASVSFDYLHCLSVPQISPKRSRGAFQQSVKADLVVKFGMLEADPEVHALHCVYDPQSAFSPKPFRVSGSTAQHLAIVANRFEILQMSGMTSIEAAVSSVMESDGAEVLVVKDGLAGATVYARGTKTSVPAFKTDKVFTIGSGDVFVAAFALAWAVLGRPPAAAAEYASRATADYVESRLLELADPDAAGCIARDPVVLSGGDVYLAGPFRETGQRMLIDDALRHLSALGMNVFSPIHDIGPGEAAQVVGKDLDAIRKCDAVFAILNGSSPGTVFEVGYACALDKPVFCVTQNLRSGDKKLPLGAGARMYDDYVTALFQIAWRT